MSSTPQFTVDPTLTAIAIAYRNPAHSLIAGRVLPESPVPSADFQYKKYDEGANFTVPDTRVGARSSVRTVEIGGEAKTTSTVDYGVGIPLDNPTIENAEKAGYKPREQADDVQATGLGLTFTPPSGGAGNPDVGTAIAALGDTWWTDVVTPWSDTANHTLLEQEAARRWAPLVAMDMHVWSAHRGTLSESVTLGEARNSKHVTCMATGKSPSPPWVWAATVGGIGAYYLKQDPGRPLQTLALPGILPAAREDQWDIGERNLLLHAGMATHRVTEADVVQIERAITGYRTNTWGFGDESYLDVQTLRLLATLRYSLRARIAQRFPRHKLRDDNGHLPTPGSKVATPKVIKGEIVALATAWLDREWIEDLEAFKEGLVVQINADDPNRVDALVAPNVINQFRVFAGLIEFIL